MAGLLAGRPLAALLLVCCLAAPEGLRQQPRQSDGKAESAEEAPRILVVVNVHEKPEVATLQCEHINLRLQKNFRPEVALSCNSFMYSNLSNTTLPPNVYLNPKVIEKKRFTGTLLRGIISNLRFLSSRQGFSYALILSSKSRIVRDITEEDIVNSIRTCSQYIMKNCSQICHMSTCESRMPWNQGRWNSFRKTLLGQAVLNGGSWTSTGSAKQPSGMLLGGIHEGLVMDAATVLKILRFLSLNPLIEEDLYHWHDAVEEFALHTLAVYVGGTFGILGHNGHDGGHRPSSFYKVEKCDRTVADFTEGFGVRPPLPFQKKKGIKIPKAVRALLGW